MAFAPLILAVASTAMSVSAASEQANQKAEMSAYNERINRANAAASLEQARADAAQQARQAEKTLGGIRAAYGASGVSLEGSAIDVLSESTTNATLDNLAIKHRGALRAQGYTRQADLDVMAGDNAISEGQSKMASSFISGASASYGAYSKAGTPVQTG